MSTPITPINFKVLGDQIFSSFKLAVLAAISNGVPQVVSIANTFLVDEEKLFKDLAIEYLNGSIDEDFLGKRIAEIKEDLINALIVIEQVSASHIEGLVTNLVNVFANLIKATLASFPPEL